MNHSTMNPIPPGWPDLNWRPITRDDLMAYVALADACWAVDGGLAFLNEPENLSGRCFPNAPGVGIGAFTPEKELVAASTVHLGRRNGIERAVIVGQVHPKFRRRGIGSYLMDWSRVQARNLLTEAGIEPKLLQISTESLDDVALQMYLEDGFEEEMQEFIMNRDLSLPLAQYSFPEGVRFTTWQPELGDQFFHAYHNAFRERPGFPGYSAEEWITDRLEDENAIDAWSLLALKGEEPVGFLNAGTEHPGGFIVQIGVVPALRRQGLATALMVETMRRMAADGETAVQLDVNLNNPGAIKAYEQLEFKIVGRRARYERILD